MAHDQDQDQDQERDQDYACFSRGWFDHHITPDGSGPADDDPYWIKHYDFSRKNVIVYPYYDGDEDEIAEYYVEVPRDTVTEQRQVIAEAQLADALDLFGLPPWIELRWLTWVGGEETARDLAVAETARAFAAAGVDRIPKIVRHAYPRYSTPVEAGYLALAMYLNAPTVIYLRAEPIPAPGPEHDFVLRQDVRHGVAFAYQALRGYAPDEVVGNRLAYEYPMLRERVDAGRDKHPEATIALDHWVPRSARSRQIELPAAVRDAWHAWIEQNRPRWRVRF